MTPARKKPNINTSPLELMPDFQFAVSVDCVIFGYENDMLKVLLIKSDLPQFKNKWSLLGDLVHPDEDLDAASYRVLRERTGLEDVFLEASCRQGCYYGLFFPDQCKGPSIKAIG
jgi:8-oxo-dGTP diphosphatase